MNLLTPACLSLAWQTYSMRPRQYRHARVVTRSEAKRRDHRIQHLTAVTKLVFGLGVLTTGISKTILALIELIKLLAEAVR